jgi:hypothetical protein
MNKLIFLDFDGVLHPYPKMPGKSYQDVYAAKSGEKWREFMCLPDLTETLEEFNNYEIVLSTAWREPVEWFNEKKNQWELDYPCSFEYLVSLFPAPVKHNIIGMTPVHKNNTRNQGRYFEILDWLVSNGRTEDEWVALDDIAGFFPDYCPNLILCDEYTGFRKNSKQDEMLTNFLLK